MFHCASGFGGILILNVIKQSVGMFDLVVKIYFAIALEMICKENGV